MTSLRRFKATDIFRCGAVAAVAVCPRARGLQLQPGQFGHSDRDGEPHWAREAVLILCPRLPQYGIGYYQHYLARWPNYFVSAEAPGGNIAGYSELSSRSSAVPFGPMLCHAVMGKAEGRGTVPWHGHISAVTVAADYRRLGLARVLMNYIEQVSDQYVLALAPRCAPVAAHLSPNH